MSAVRANSNADIEITIGKSTSARHAPGREGSAALARSGKRWSELTLAQQEKLNQRWLDAAQSANVWSSMCLRRHEVSYACDQYMNELRVLSEACEWGEKTLCETWSSAMAAHGWGHLKR